MFVFFARRTALGDSKPRSASLSGSPRIAAAGARSSRQLPSNAVRGRRGGRALRPLARLALCSPSRTRSHRGFSLNDDQSLVFDTVRALIDGSAPADSPDAIYIDGPAGTGKTHIHRKFLHNGRGSGRKALAVAMSGTAALPLPGGRTAHSRFRLQVPARSSGASAT